MFEGVKQFFRRRSIAKHASREETRITPIREIRSAVAFIDVEDTSFDECKNELNAFFRENRIKGDIFFFDFRKLTEGERLITSITTTVLKKEPDMFISLLRKDDFPITFMAAVSKAHFKVGRVQLPGNVFDLVVSDPADRQLSEAEVFLEIRKLLDKIQ